MSSSSANIFIVGGSASSPSSIEYDTGARTVVVEDDLVRAFGSGMLKKADDGRGVSDEFLAAGTYRFHVTSQVSTAPSTNCLLLTILDLF